MKRQNILCAAARLFAERGFNNTPTILLAQEAGVAEGTIFRHFKTKDEIFYVLLENVREQLLHDMRGILTARRPATGMDSILALLREFCIFVRRNPMEFGLVFRDASCRYGEETDPAFLTIKSLYADLGQMLHDTIAQGQEDGSIDSSVHAEDTASLLLCQLIGFTRGLHFNLIPHQAGERQMLTHFLDNAAKLLRPQPVPAL